MAATAEDINNDQLNISPAKDVGMAEEASDHGLRFLPWQDRGRTKRSSGCVYMLESHITMGRPQHTLRNVSLVRRSILTVCILLSCLCFRSLRLFWSASITWLHMPHDQMKAWLTAARCLEMQNGHLRKHGKLLTNQSMADLSLPFRWRTLVMVPPMTVLFVPT